MCTQVIIAALALALDVPLPLTEPLHADLTCEVAADGIYIVRDTESGPALRVRATVLETLKGEKLEVIDMPVRFPQAVRPHYLGRTGTRKLVFVKDGTVYNLTGHADGPGCGPVAEDGIPRRSDPRRYPDAYHRFLGDKTDFERAVIFVRAFLAALENPTPRRLARLIESTELAEWRAGMSVRARVDVDDRSDGWIRIGEAITRRLAYDLEYFPLYGQDVGVLHALGRTLRILEQRRLAHGDPLPEWRDEAARVLVSHALRSGAHSTACASLPKLGYEVTCEEFAVPDPHRPRAHPTRIMRFPSHELERLEDEHEIIFYRGIRPDELPEDPDASRRMGVPRQIPAD